MLFKVVLTFYSVDETLVCDHSNEGYWAVLSCGIVNYAMQDGSYCEWNCFGQLTNLTLLHSAGNLERVVSSSLDHPYGITLLDRFVYWTDSGNKSVFRAEKQNGTNITVITTGGDVLRDVRVFSPQRQPPGGPCVNNGGCEELCLAVSSSQRRLVLYAFLYVKSMRGEIGEKEGQSGDII